MGPDFHVVKESHSATEYAEPEAQTLDPELHYDDSEGYILDVNQLGPNASTKTAPDDDPLNWSQAKKHTLLAVIIACTFLPDYGSATGAITLIPQAGEFGITPDEVNHSQSGNQFMVGAGGVVAVMLSAYFGRLPVLFARIYIRRHQGRLEPEARLSVIYTALPFLLTGLVVLGFALERKWHYMVTAVGWGMYVFGSMVVSVGISTYLLDSYPCESGEVGAWINFSRTAGGFIVAYLQGG
ncbi:MAG: hypothetical protein Q9192_003029 [Flavoplaca navasiana]